MGIINSLVDIIDQLIRERDVSAGLVSNLLWAIPVFLLLSFRWLNAYQFGLHIRLIYLTTISYPFDTLIRKKIKNNDFPIDGFYYAVYDFSDSDLSETMPKTIINDRKVFECIYISSGLFSNRVAGYVIRRAEQKGKINTVNSFFFANELQPLRFVGSFSSKVQIFFGYWLDPYNASEVAGTVRLKWIDNNDGIDPHQRKIKLIGHWDGFNKNEPLKNNEESRKYYGYPKRGGAWRFHQIGTKMSDYYSWRETLSKEGDVPNTPEKFIDFEKKIMW